MADARLRQQWLMHGRLTIDLINSQRTVKEQLDPAVFKYPYFESPEQKLTQKERELMLAKQLQGSKWLTVTIL